jgi:hypothetical protein
MAKYLLGGGVVLLLVLGLWWQHGYADRNPGVLARNGLHWHPQLEIYVKGERVEIPQNIGLGESYRGKPGYGQGNMAMTPMHTHDDQPVIHLEFSGVVRTDDIRLGKFFEIWGKDLQAFGVNPQMTVNGIPNTDYGSYVMRDGDRIELRYE